jgi:hypothetical protein
MLIPFFRKYKTKFLWINTRFVYRMNVQCHISPDEHRHTVRHDSGKPTPIVPTVTWDAIFSVDEPKVWATGVGFPARAGVFLFATRSRPAQEPTQPPVQWVGGKANEGWRWSLSSICCQDYEWVELYLICPIRVDDVVLGTGTTALVSQLLTRSPSK